MASKTSALKTFPWFSISIGKNFSVRTTVREKAKTGVFLILLTIRSTRIIIFHTSGFWPRVRARALRAPVFLGSLTCQTGRCAPPPRPSQLRCPPKIKIFKKQNASLLA
jgi:hypothetical protein